MSLFRPEVYENRRFRLHGDVMLTGATSNWALVGLLVFIAISGVAWVATGHYSRTEKVVGRIVPDGALTRIMPTRAGVIVKLTIKEGDRVVAGQPLATVQVEQGSADRANPTAEDLGSIDQQHRLIEAQIGLSHRSQVYDAAKLSANIAQYRSEISGLSEQIDHQTRIVQSAKDSFDPLTAVMEKGFVTKTEYEQRRQAYLSSQVQLAQLKTQRAQLDGQLREAEVVQADIPTQAASKINDLMTSQASLVQRRIEIENAGSYVITAPVSGHVSALQVAQGSTVTSELPLMSIVNDGAHMMAELYAPSRAIGFAKPGQEVRLMFDAFPYERFGSFKGHIATISRTVLAPKEVDAAVDIKEPVYRIRVSMPDQMVKAFGERVPLQPGMTLNANIVLDRRSFLDWLMEPINAVRNRA